MVQRTSSEAATLFEADETAWLEHTAELVRSGDFDQVESNSLAEYLTDMAKRDRREVLSRLVVLLTHLLKWHLQPDQQSGSWRGTIREQRRELRQLLESRTLLNHATTCFAEAYLEARAQSADETGLELSVFPQECPWDLDTVLNGTEQ